LALTNIRDIVIWLKYVEGSVGSLYAQAAKACAHDKHFSTFLASLAEDEKSHAQFMAIALEYLSQKQNLPAVDIVLDQKTRDSVETTLKRFEGHLLGESITKGQVVEYIATAEFSELNPIFLYVISKFGKMTREAESISAGIQAHLSRIQDFINALPQDLKPSVDVDMFPSVWKERFLVVDDHEGLRELVASLLARRGRAETASEASEALEKIRQHFYNIIVSDVQMPRMDGIEFYHQSVAYDSRLKGRFLFYFADVNPEQEAFLKENRLHFLRKPFSLDELLDTMDQMLRQ